MTIDWVVSTHPGIEDDKNILMAYECDSGNNDWHIISGFRSHGEWFDHYGGKVGLPVFVASYNDPFLKKCEKCGQVLKEQS